MHFANNSQLYCVAHYHDPGKDETAFTIHKDVMTEASSHFKRLLTPGTRESHKRQVKLPEADPKLFEHLLKYLYAMASNDIFLCHRDDITESYPGSTIDNLKAWLLAAELGIPCYQNYLIRELAEECGERNIQAQEVEFAINSVGEKEMPYAFIMDQLAMDLIKRRYSGDLDKMTELLAPGFSTISKVLLAVAQWGVYDATQEPFEVPHKYFVASSTSQT